MNLKVKILNNFTSLPEYAKEGDAGLDLSSADTVEFPFQKFVQIRTGVAVEIPEGHVGLVFPRSSTFRRYGIIFGNHVGVIDSGYRGELLVQAFRVVPDPAQKFLNSGTKFAQLVVVPFVRFEKIEEAKTLSDTERGEGGFGHSS